MNKIKLYILYLLSTLFSFTLLVNGQDPRISFITKKQIVTIGDPVALECRTQYAQTYPVHWVKISSGNVYFLTQSASLTVQVDRYHVKFDSAKQAYNFTIDKVQEIDAGDYECRIALSAQNFRNARVSVLVRIPPVISDNSTRSIITAVNSTVDFHCSASGYPAPKIYWRRERNELLPNKRGAQFNGPTLRIYNVTKDDRGTYYCVADNGVLPGARRAISLEVEFEPVIKVGRSRVGQALQYYQDLQCTIEAFPSSTIVWMKDGERLADNQNYEISLFDKSDEFVDTILRIKRIEKKQYGNYQCRAVNKLGASQKDILLFETVNVICPPACEAYQAPTDNGHNLIHLSILKIILISFLLTFLH